MAAPNYEYVALRVIEDPHRGVRAFNPGDLVPASHVRTDDNEDGWLIVGEDVQPREEWQAALEQAEEPPAGQVDTQALADEVTAAADRPARNASKADWVGYAVSRGMDQGEAEAATRDDLIEQYG